ncbi:MAG: nitronate monooxygenase [Dermatophilaceae bacterium]
MRAAGIVVLATVTSPEEALAADALGVDALVVQGPESGGHRGTHSGATEPDTRPLDELLAAVRAAIALPLIAAGGLMSAADVRRVLDLGALAAQCGTAFLRSPEAGTSATHPCRTCRRPFTESLATRAFTGRVARGLRNSLRHSSMQSRRSAIPQCTNSPGRCGAAAPGTAMPNGPTCGPAPAGAPAPTSRPPTWCAC